MAAFAVAHVGDNCSGAIHHAIDVDAGDALVHVVGEAAEWGWFWVANHVGVGGNASIQTNNVEIVVFDKHFVPGCCAGDIQMHKRAANGRSNFFAECVVDVGYNNSCALCRKAASHFGANAACAASDERALSC